MPTTTYTRNYLRHYRKSRQGRGSRLSHFAASALRSETTEQASRGGTAVQRTVPSASDPSQLCVERLLTERYRAGLIDQHQVREDLRAAADACRRLPAGAYPGLDLGAVADGVEEVAGRSLGLGLDHPDEPGATDVPERVRSVLVGLLQAIAERRFLGPSQEWGHDRLRELRSQEPM